MKKEKEKEKEICILGAEVASTYGRRRMKKIKKNEEGLDRDTISVVLMSGRTNHVLVCPSDDVHLSYGHLIRAAAKASVAMTAWVTLWWFEERLAPDSDSFLSLLTAPAAKRIVTAVVAQPRMRFLQRFIAERNFLSWSSLMPPTLVDSNSSDNADRRGHDNSSSHPDSDSDEEGFDFIFQLLDCRCKAKEQEATVEARLEVQKKLVMYRRLVEVGKMHQSCKDLLVPVMRKAEKVCQNGSLQKCRVMQAVMSARLQQVVPMALKIDRIAKGARDYGSCIYVRKEKNEENKEE